MRCLKVNRYVAFWSALRSQRRYISKTCFSNKSQPSFSSEKFIDTGNEIKINDKSETKHSNIGDFTLTFEDLNEIKVNIPERVLKETSSRTNHTSSTDDKNQDDGKMTSVKTKRRSKKKGKKETALNTEFSKIKNSNDEFIAYTQTPENALQADIAAVESLTDGDLMIRNNTFTDFYQNIIDTYKEYSDRKDGVYIVLFHVGSFYELYFEQADKYSSMLGLTLTKKNLKSGPISFSGFPDRMLDKYMDIIYNKGYKAVICNQVLDALTNTITRPIDRIMTPGIVIDESCRDFHRNNYLLALSFPEDIKSDIDKKKIGVSWCDVSLGLFYVLEINFNQLLSTITRINPSEILISDKTDIDEILGGCILPELVDMKSYYITCYHQSTGKKPLDDFIWRFSDNKRLVSTTLDSLSLKEKNATSMILHYLDICLPNYKTSFQLPTRSLPKTLMQIDSRVAQDLELLETLQSRKRIGALSHLIDKTITSPGARLLNTWLLAPSTDINEIENRHMLLDLFKKDVLFLDNLGQLLRKTADINRILRRIDNSKAASYEYLEFSKTITILDNIYELFVNTFGNQIKLFDPIFADFISSKKIHRLAKQIEKTIDSRVSYQKANTNKLDGDFIREFWEIKDSASSQLRNLRKEYDILVEESKEHLKKLTAQFRNEGYMGSVRLVRDLKSYEYVVELKSTSKVIPKLIENLDFKVKERSKSMTKLLDQKWSDIGNKLVRLEVNISTEEIQIMKNLDSKILDLSIELRKVSPIIELIDVIRSFSELALEYNLVRPVIDDSTIFEVKAGRHIVVEEGLKNRVDFVNFTTNNCNIDKSEAWIITGPNMGGKSTFLRQNALIAILAQIGSYVPADEAHIGVIDKIFTRVGSSDNIFKHQSTFMVEMNETAIILREATERSLVIVDELGRGTSTNEGVAIAYAALMRLLTVNKSKVLFATHFGPELYKLIELNSNSKDMISFYKTNLVDLPENEMNYTIDQRVIFDHKLTEGISLHSHALKIAELAGFPNDALKLAASSFEQIRR